MTFGDNNDCRGYLVEEAHRGLSYMFQLMNEALVVGIAAAGIASAAYHAALEYAKERPQGRPLAAKDPLSPQIPIIEHADVKRMLLFQRSIVEGSLSLLMQCGKYVDMEKVLEGDEKEKYHLLLEILTPVAKTYPAEMGILSVSQAMQCLGGYGYCNAGENRSFPGGRNAVSGVFRHCHNRLAMAPPGHLRREGLEGKSFPGGYDVLSGKISTFRYFFHYELPKIEGLASTLLDGSGITVEIEKDSF